jgi:hypothetical protein
MPMTAPASPLVALRQMRRAAEVLAADDDDCRAIAAAFGAYLDPGVETRLEELLGLAVIGQGGEAWRSTARRALRDQALRELASLQPGVSVAAQAAAIRKMVRRYEIRWRRVDQHREAPPAAYAGTPEGSLYAAFAASVREAFAERDAAVVMTRKGLVAGIREIEREAEAEFPKLMAASEAAIAAIRAAEKVQIEASARANQAMAARSNASFGYTRRRDLIENELRAGADNEAIDEFIRTMRGELDRTHKRLEYVEESRRSQVTNRAVRQVRNNMASIAARVSAINEAMLVAEALRFEPDQSTVPGRLAELRAGLPEVAQLTRVS